MHSLPLIWTLLTLHTIQDILFKVAYTHVVYVTSKTKKRPSKHLPAFYLQVAQGETICPSHRGDLWTLRNFIVVAGPWTFHSLSPTVVSSLRRYTGMWLSRHLAYLKFLPPMYNQPDVIKVISRGIMTAKEVAVLEIGQWEGILASLPDESKVLLMGSVYWNRHKRSC